MAIRWRTVTATAEGEPFRLLQISDCHLSADIAAPYRGRNADEGLGKLVDRARSWQPHGVLVTGDLSEDASEAAYARLADYLSRFEAPVCVLPGNHDDDVVAARYFPEGPWGAPRLLEAGAWRLVLLKSSVTGRIDGAIDPAHLAVVRQWMQGEPGNPFLIALHHQPVPVGGPWIDRHMLKPPEALLALVENADQVRAVVWGHVHHAFESPLGRARLLSCPSSAANSLPNVQRFTDDGQGAACRWLQLHGNGDLETGLMRAE